MQAAWPEVAVVALILLRDELRFWRLTRSAAAVRQAVEGSTVVVRSGDDLPHDQRGDDRERRGHDADSPQDL